MWISGSLWSKGVGGGTTCKCRKVCGVMEVGRGIDECRSSMEE